MPIRILIVDDEPYNLDILRIYFKSLNYEVYESKTGEDAINKVETVNPNLILLDVMLPDISGYDVCKRLNELEDFRAPIIFLSANTQKDAILKGLDLGVFDYLTKPFDLELLVKKVNIALSHQKNYKREFNQRLEFDIEQAKANRKALSFMILQLDEFDMIYGSLGQRALDLLFQSITTRLKKSGIAISMISRQAPDKILVILPNNPQVVTEEMEQIILLLSGQSYSLFPFDGEDVQSLIRHAEMATHSAKRSGGVNKLTFYTPAMDSYLSKRMKMENRLRRTAEKNEFSLHYQPKINIHTGKLIGAEALIRWTDQELGIVPPSEFIPLAEEIGLINWTGYSSLSYLKKFPIDCLKIDRSFIKDIIHDADMSEITNANISLAHTLNLKVIAEGVETEQQLQYPRNKQCDEVQGYYFNKPLASVDFEEYLITYYRHVTGNLESTFIS